ERRQMHGRIDESFSARRIAQSKEVGASIAAGETNLAADFGAVIAANEPLLTAVSDTNLLLGSRLHFNHDLIAVNLEHIVLPHGAPHSVFHPPERDYCRCNFLIAFSAK